MAEETTAKKIRLEELLSVQCAIEMSIIRRAAKLLKILSDAEVLKIVRDG